MKCSSCDFENPKEGGFCGNCGAQLGSVCTGCGANNPVGFSFCGQCGAELSSPRRNAEEAERRQLTVMFCDLVESTALAERLDPEDLRDIVRDYQSEVADVVEKYSGHIAQYLGDGLLIYFGYPQAHEDDARRAVLAGLEIVQSISRTSHALQQTKGVSIEVRIGLHTGPVVTGQVGSGSQAEVLALGSTPNIAARIQGIAHPGEVYLSRFSHDLLATDFEMESIGEVDLRGVGKPVQVYRAIRFSGGEADDRQQLPFAGRDAEIATILEAFQAAEAGHGQLVLIKGEAGIGKTRLQREVRRQIDSDNVTWLTCRCSAYHQNSALYPIISGLEAAFGFQSEDSRSERLSKVTEGLAELGEPGGESLAAVLGLLSLTNKADTVSHDRDSTFSALVDLITRRAEVRTMIFAIEDLHWVDPSTRDLISALLQRLDSSRTLIIASSRSDFEPGWQHVTHQHLLELNRLSDQDCRTVLDTWSIGKELPFHVRREVANRTDGIPLFLEEVARTLKAAQDSAGLGADTIASTIPTTLRDSLTARLDSLGPAKEVAQLGALLGRQFNYRLLAATSEFQSQTLRLYLEQLVTGEVLVQRGEIPDASFSFRHSLIQENAYESLLRRRRKELHHHVSNILEVEFPELALSEPETMARHCELGQRYQDALNHYQSAASLANARWGYSESIHCYHKALELLEHEQASENRDRRELELISGLADPMFAHSGYTDPALSTHYERAAHLIRSLGDPVAEINLTMNVWGFHCVRGDRQETVDAAQRLEELVHESGSAAQIAIVSFVRACTCMFLGDQEKAIPLFDHANGHYLDRGLHEREGGTRHPLFLCWAQSPWCFTLAGFPVRATDILDSAWDVAFRENDPLAKCQVLSYRCAVGQDIGVDAGQIQQDAQQIISIASEQGLAAELQYGRIYRGWARAMQADAEGLDEFQDAIRESNLLGSLATWSRSLAKLSQIFLRFGEIDQALSVVESCLDVCRTNLGKMYEPEALRVKGDILAAQGDVEAAEVQISRALSMAGQQGSKWLELKAAMSIARLLDATAREQDGRLLLQSNYEWFTEGWDTAVLQEAKQILDG
jgi:class 3 adenylate cyclase/tetratricopeptide (TPR) repeat protein